ncbi:MAG TPA: alcohol dehydrogenase catalytic domain-containing protein [Candidatus Binataceae bacterium]|nr:alcohol dehydrogenase catalytic domain-containing protein [Candidatus Binataceae bacterium]
MSAAALPAYQGPPRQAMLLAPGRIELRDFTPQRPGAGELLVRIRCALSCGTDLKTWRRGHPLWKFPMPFGHEFSGVVAESGAGVERFKPGDEVMAAPTAPCGACFYCARGQENLCEDAVGRMLRGAYADLIMLPAHIVARNTFIKPSALPFEEAALLEPLSCVIHAHAMAGPQKSETAMIIGAGAFGMLHMIALRAAGVREIVIAGRGAARLKWAAALGADRVIDAEHQDAAAEAAKCNGGFGPDLAIECTGAPAGWADAFARVRRGGRVVFFGGCAPGTTLSVDTRRMHYDNLSLLAPFHYRPRDVRAAYEMLARSEPAFGAVINSHRTLAELDQVFPMLERGEALKCAVIP